MTAAELAAELMDRLQAPIWLVALAVTAYFTIRAVMWLQVIRDKDQRPAPVPTNGSRDMKVHRAELAGAWRERMEGHAVNQQRLLEQVSKELRLTNKHQGEQLSLMQQQQEAATAQGKLLTETHRIVKELNERRSA